VALARIVFANREHIISVEPWDEGMLATTLRYDYEVRDDKKLFKSIPKLRVKKDMVELAGHILDRKAGHFDPEEFKDEYELALRKLVKRKAAGYTIEAPATPEPPSNVVNIMDALKDSLKRKKTTSASNRKKSHRPKSSKRLRKAS
jgi:DNA end-binding protein Ku